MQRLAGSVPDLQQRRGRLGGDSAILRFEPTSRKLLEGGSYLRRTGYCPRYHIAVRAYDRQPAASMRLVFPSKA